MEGRSFSERDYRFGFQGQESDSESGFVNYKYRMHNPRIGRFFSVDPLAPKYPHNSPYAFSENRVIDGVELEGLEWYFSADGRFAGKYGNSNKIRVINNDKITLFRFKEFRTKYKSFTKNVPLFLESLLINEASIESQKKIIKKENLMNKLEDNNVSISEVEIKKQGGMHVPEERPKGSSPIFVNIGLSNNGEFLFNDFKNMSNSLFHESLHLRGLTDDPWGHFKIIEFQTKRNDFKFSTSSYKDWISEVANGYLESQESEISQQIGLAKLKGTSKKLFYDKDFKERIENYNQNVFKYNKMFNKRRKAKTFKN